MNVEKPREFKSRFSDGPLFSLAGDVLAILARGEQTEGRYTLAEGQIPPGGGPPPHVHTREDEEFYVLEGEITITVAGRPHVARAGTFVHGPRGIEHTFRNTGRQPARMLVWTLPAGFEKFLEEAGERLAPGVTDPVPVTPAIIDKLLSLAPKYGIEIHLPK